MCKSHGGSRIRTATGIARRRACGYFWLNLLEAVMALFMIERNFAEEFNASASDYAAVIKLNDQAGVKWLYSFLSADKRKTYCLYEARSGDAIREAARLA